MCCVYMLCLYWSVYLAVFDVYCVHVCVVFTCCVFIIFIRTLDLGFEKDLTVILNALNSGGCPRQNVLLSATLTEGKQDPHIWGCRDPCT